MERTLQLFRHHEAPEVTMLFQRFLAPAYMLLLASPAALVSSLLLYLIAFSGRLGAAYRELSRCKIKFFFFDASRIYFQNATAR